MPRAPKKDAAPEDVRAAAAAGPASIDEVLAELAAVVARLEAGDGGLDEALATFERGVVLARTGSRLLDALEERVEVLLSDGRTEPFTPATDEQEP